MSEQHDEPATGTDVPQEFESAAFLKLKKGRLRLAGGRLSWTGHQGNVVFDAPVEEFEDFAFKRLKDGFTIRHGDARYKLLMDERVDGGHASNIVHSTDVGRVAGAVQGISRQRARGALAHEWERVLTGRLASPPSTG